MNRRAFLSAAAVAAAATAARSPAQTSRRIKTCFLGVSHSHARDKLQLIRSDPRFEFVGAAEEDLQARARHPGLNWRPRGELLGLCDLAVVESEVRDHARDALEALRAGRHVHVEKPAAATLHEMQSMTRVAREKGLLLQTGYMWRYHPGFDAIFEAVRAGWLGEVYQVQGHMSNLLAREQRAAWAEFKGGSMFEQGSHLIDPLIRLLGQPDKVQPLLVSTLGDALADNNAAIFQFPRALGIITNSTNQPNGFAHRSFEVRGTRGTMLLKPVEPPVLEVDLASAAGPYKIGKQVIPLPDYRRYTGEFDDLATALSGGSRLKISLDEDLLAHEWILRASAML